MAASSTLSVSNCRTIRERPAPSAARIASSPRRWAPRASRRFVTFRQAIISTNATAPAIATSEGLTALVTSCCSGCTIKPPVSDAQSGRTNSGTAAPAIWTISRVA